MTEEQSVYLGFQSLHNILSGTVPELMEPLKIHVLFYPFWQIHVTTKRNPGMVPELMEPLKGNGRGMLTTVVLTYRWSGRPRSYKDPPDMMELVEHWGTPSFCSLSPGSQSICKEMSGKTICFSFWQFFLFPYKRKFYAHISLHVFIHVLIFRSSFLSSLPCWQW